MNEVPNPFSFRRLLQVPVLLPLYLYTRYLSLLFPPRCRFYPSCSRYTYEGIYYHGMVRGGLLAIKRLTKCHPWHEGGFDPLPSISNNCCSHHPSPISPVKESLS